MIAPVTKELHVEYCIRDVAHSVLSRIEVNDIERRLVEPWPDCEIEQFFISASNIENL